MIPRHHRQPSLQNVTVNFKVAPKSKTYQDVEPVDKLGDSNFTVYLAFSKSLNKYFAMKVFPYDEKSSVYFNRESRVKNLSHPNIISVLETETKKDWSYGSEYKQFISYILMELSPYGTFLECVRNPRFYHDEKLTRTYFHQLMSALDYLHSNGLVHLDIKLSNLLLGKNFILKLIDFDSCLYEEEEKVYSRGTMNYRAPEIQARMCKDKKAADIYSAGIILFALRMGTLPYDEECHVHGHNLMQLLRKGDDYFWEIHASSKERPECTDDFKALFEWMVSANPEKRPSIEQIKESKWYNGDIYEEGDLRDIMRVEVKIPLASYVRKKEPLS